MVRYVRSDSKALITSMSDNVKVATEIIEKLTSGSHHLIQAVDGKTLSGAAYTAGKGLFSELILPTISKVGKAVEDLQNDLTRYQNADSSVNHWSLIDSDLQDQKIGLIQSQISILQVQIQATSNLLVGSIAKTAMENLQYENRSLENVLNDYQDQLIEARQKRDALDQFEASVNGLFTAPLTQLKLVIQSIEVLNDTTIDASTGGYKLPKGTDKSWFNSVKKESVKNAEENGALKDGRAGLYLSEAGRAYYDKIMREALKNVPPEKWAETLAMLNYTLLFDDDGNIIRMGDVNMGSGSGLVVIKNGVYDSELSLQADRELTDAQKAAFRQYLPEISSGLATILAGLGIGGLDAGGTVFSGGGLALSGISEAGVAASFSTITAGGAITADALEKILKQNSGVEISFASNYSERSSNPPTSKTFGKPVEGRVNGKKSPIRVDAEPDSNSVHIQTGGGKTSPLKDEIDVSKITDKSSIYGEISNKIKRGLSKGKLDELVNNIWKACQWLKS